MGVPDDSLPRPNEVQQSKGQKQWIAEKRKRDDDPAFDAARRAKNLERQKKSRALAQARAQAQAQAQAQAPAQAQAQAQAVGWQEAVSPGGHRYYYNPGTGQSQWERPQEQMGMYMDEDDSAV